ncbi:unnamed protein product, partial [Adineta steineri]
CNGYRAEPQQLNASIKQLLAAQEHGEEIDKDELKRQINDRETLEDRLIRLRYHEIIAKRFIMRCRRKSI